MDKENSSKIFKEYKEWADKFKPITIYEYLEIEPEIKSFDDITLSKNLLTKSESSPKRLYNIAAQNKIKKKDRHLYPFFREGKRSIRGLPEVMEQVVKRLYTASESFKNNQIPLILLAGPTGGGKTEVGRILENGFIRDLYKNPKYTYSFKDTNGKGNFLCPFTEDPLNLLTSSYILIPRFIKKKFSQTTHGELCPYCRKKVDQIIREGSSQTSDYLELLNDKIDVVRLQPKTAAVKLSAKRFQMTFKKAMEKANRGILHVEIDDRDLDTIPDTNYQLMLSLADRRIAFGDGSYFTPDLVVLLYANENIIKDLDEKSAFKDRILKVHMRRNLSYSEEEKIFKKMGLEKAFKHITPNGLEVLAKFSVGSRIYATDENELKNLLEIFEKNELFQDLTADEKKIIIERLPESDVPEDGWTSGLSTRASMGFLYTILNEPNQCLTLENISNFLDKIEPNLDSYMTETDPYAVYTLSKQLIHDIAFRDTALAFTALTLGNIKEVEKRFFFFLELMKMKYLKNKKVVTVPGAGEVPIALAMAKIMKDINMEPSKMSKLENIISEYMDPEKEKGRPTYGEILISHPELITENKSIKEYIHWNELRRGGLSTADEEKVEKLLEIMKQLKYDEECGQAALRIASERIGK